MQKIVLKNLKVVKKGIYNRAEVSIGVLDRKYNQSRVYKILSSRGIL